VRAEPLSLAQLHGRLYGASAAEQLSPLFDRACLVLDLRGEDPAALAAAPARVPNCPVLAHVRPGQAVPALVDVACTDEAELATIVAAIERSPLAALMLVQLLRHNEAASVEDGLFAESLVYSTLQGSAVFRAWLAARVPKPARPEAGPLVRVESLADGRLLLVLDRPHKRNAYSASVRDALVEALQFALDAGVPGVVLRGAGPAFSAGGDLDEFGSANDGALAHAVRMTRSAAHLLHGLRDRVVCEVHGACIGAGIELPAFTGRIVAAPDSHFVLPEVGMGLVPGAGGTVSITKRIGRLRTAAMALSGQRVDAQTALAWGLVDAIA
jgi:enoyl-CoA hydratase